MKVVFLGLGIMGKAMSMNLLKNGFKVTVWNRTLSKSKFVALKLCDCSVMNWWLMVPWFDKPQQKWLRSVRSPLPCCLILLLLFRLSLIKMVFLCKFAAVKVTSTCRRLIRRLLAKSVRRSRQKVANSLRPLFLVANSLQKLVNW